MPAEGTDVENKRRGCRGRELFSRTLVSKEHRKSHKPDESHASTACLQCITLIFVICISSGKVPVDKDRLKICVRTGESNSIINFTGVRCKSSASFDVLLFR